jgi:hypothetical protein
MSARFRVLAVVAGLALCSGSELLACGDKFLVTGRGTRYQRPKNARSANVLIYADPASGLPETVKGVPVASLLKREGHQATTVSTLDQLAALLVGGRFDVVLVANTVVSAVQKLLPGQDAPVMVSMCVKPAKGASAPTGSCAVKAPAKEGSLLEAIDRAVAQHDRNARKAEARG